MFFCKDNKLYNRKQISINSLASEFEEKTERINTNKINTKLRR